MQIAEILVLVIRASAIRTFRAGISRTRRSHNLARDLDPEVLGEVARLVSKATDLDVRVMDREASATAASVMNDSAVSITVSGTAGTAADGMGAATICGSSEICSV
jgi:hypothetical protein